MIRPMKRQLAFLCLLLHPLFVAALLGQSQGSSSSSSSSSDNSSTKDAAGAEVVEGPDGFLSIDYKGGRFLVPFRCLVSVARHDFLLDGGGMVHELTIDTQGSVIARYYYLESILENNPTNAAQIVNNRLKKVGDIVEQRTGVDSRVVIKHYPDTTHAKTVEFNVSSMELLERIYDYIYDDWVLHNGKSGGHTLKIK
jgi:hypothetical protein